MKEVTFTVLIGEYSAIDVYEEVTTKEYMLLKKYADRHEMDFKECDKLSGLYARVIEDAYDEMANSVYDDKDFIDEYLDGEYDFIKAWEYFVEYYELTAVWPAIEKRRIKNESL